MKNCYVLIPANIQLQVILCACMIAFAFGTSAQEDEPSFSDKPVLAVDATLASNFTGNALALSTHRMHPIAFGNRFEVGYGLRFTGFYGQRNGFVTAPASVSEGNFFKKQNEAKLDTLYLPNSSVGSVNLAIFLAYRISPKITAEFNIDAVGLSFGADRSGEFQAESQQASTSGVSAYVTPYNLLLTGDYDIGSLNSELSLNIQVSDHLWVRPGVSFLFTEFTTYTPLAFDNDRFRKKSLLPMIGISYHFGPVKYEAP